MPSTLALQIFGFSQLWASSLSPVAPRCPRSVSITLLGWHFFLHLHLGQRASHLLAPTEKHSASGHRAQKLQKSEIWGDFATISLTDCLWPYVLIPARTGVWSTLINICKSPWLPQIEGGRKGQIIINHRGNKNGEIKFCSFTRDRPTHTDTVFTVGELDRNLISFALPEMSNVCLTWSPIPRPT